MGFQCIFDCIWYVSQMALLFSTKFYSVFMMNLEFFLILLSIHDQNLKSFSKKFIDVQSSAKMTLPYLLIYSEIQNSPKTVCGQQVKDVKYIISNHLNKNCRRSRVQKFPFSYLFFSLASHSRWLRPNFWCGKICIYHNNISHQLKWPKIENYVTVNQKSDYVTRALSNHFR